MSIMVVLRWERQSAVCKAGQWGDSGMAEERVRHGRDKTTYCIPFISPIIFRGGGQRHLVGSLKI
jgi:hypothetical protein